MESGCVNASPTAMPERRTLLPLALLLGLLICGCGSEGSASAPPDYAKALRGSPAPLAALHAEGGELLDGGSEAFEGRLAELRGYPVVVNVWGSWCGPCRFEFPALQRASARYGKRVAFVGIDSQDNDDAAARFLEENPVPYPSYRDPDKDLADDVGAFALPATAYYDRDGELAFIKQGAYKDDEALRADIERCALGRPPGCEGG
jgi:thiol-disulfide isomerase/thioredoxin